VTPDPALRTAVSCTIITKNEADRINRCLESVRGLVSEIIVVDSGSTDETLAICRAFGATCFHRDWEGYGQQKRFAESKASHDWILNLDADEWLTQATRAELSRLLTAPIPQAIHGFEFKITQVYPGDERPRPFADYHNYIRLYDRTRCRFPDSAVFDEIKLPGAHKGRIKAPIFHQSIRSIAHLVEKNIAYYKLQTGEIKKKSPLTLVRIGFEPLSVFFKYYFMKMHVTGGVYGFIVAITIAMLRTYRLAILYFPKERTR
jgi:glycosyltransferase involved in cell wall biosynthesis